MTEPIHLFGPQELYRHWEDEQWSPTAVSKTGDSRFESWLPRSFVLIGVCGPIVVAARALFVRGAHA